MAEKVNQILKEVLEEVEPSKEELKIINENLKKFIEDVRKKIKKSGIEAEVFVGGSFAKGTVIRKKNYDIDIFIRFDRKYRNENISEKTKKLLGNLKISVIHGSRDYFRMKIREDVIFEIIPVIRIKNQKEAENVTDLSYFHVSYIKKKVKTKKILDDIKLAKVFCHANNCYGAESYINGFSGYSLELLVYHYKGFLNFIKAMTKIKEKEIIDIEKLYKNKNSIMLDLNSSKLKSPIILIDPTYMQRNALSALSRETFEKFRKVCINFLKNPGIEYFRTKKQDLEKLKKESKRKGYEFILLETQTKKQEGDVAGSKLLKFFRHLNEEIEKYFEVKNKGFEYEEGKNAEYFFIAKRKKEIIVNGPEIKDKENIKKFRSRHKNVFIKNKKLYAREKVNFNLREFIMKWKAKNERKIKEMAVEELRIDQ
ncbi:MAG TPA: nucleotidyltransferase domain-containing protein [Patescibacteria group bacterium]|nr:nucleotidyltransferase domain-containing protein [Patescibacteria group bacterium]